MFILVINITILSSLHSPKHFSLGKPEDLPHVNGGFTRPKGPSHPAVGQGVNCPPLGPPGHWSSPGG